MSSGSVWG